MAARDGDLEKVKQLLDGTSIDIKDDNGVSVMRVHLDVFQVCVFSQVSVQLLSESQ